MNKKIFIGLALVIILTLCGIGGTVSWLTRTDKLVNTFIIGSFERPSTSPIDQSKISLDGYLYEPSWDSKIEHKLLPGLEYDKDPYIGIGKGSVDAVVYIYVENNFSNKIYFNLNNGWEAVEANSGFKTGTYTSGLFKYKEGLNNASDSDVWTDTPLFDKVIIDDTALSIDFEVSSGKNPEIVIFGFIHQANDGNGNKIDEAIILKAAKNAFGI